MRELRRMRVLRPQLPVQRAVSIRQQTSADVSACGYCARSFRFSVLKSEKRRKTRQHTSVGGLNLLTLNHIYFQPCPSQQAQMIDS